MTQSRARAQRSLLHPKPTDRTDLSPPPPPPVYGTLTGRRRLAALLSLWICSRSNYYHSSSRGSLRFSPTRAIGFLRGRTISSSRPQVSDASLPSKRNNVCWACILRTPCVASIRLAQNSLTFEIRPGRYLTPQTCPVSKARRRGSFQILQQCSASHGNSNEADSSSQQTLSPSQQTLSPSPSRMVLVPDKMWHAQRPWSVVPRTGQQRPKMYVVIVGEENQP